MRISESLLVAQGKTACAACGHALAAAGSPWKPHAVLRTRAARSLPGAGLAIDERVLLRHFSCPGCGALLDTETALPDDPFLDDLPAA